MQRKISNVHDVQLNLRLRHCVNCANFKVEMLSKMRTYPLSYAKKRIFSLFLVLGLSVFSQLIVAQTGLGIHTVVIDPGHGGKDPGAIGVNKIQEKDVVLSVSLKLGELIKSNFPDVNVVYTRNTDVFIGLADRAKKANKIGADLFISVHANAHGNKKAKGIETWVLGLHKTKAAMEVLKRENSAILMEDDHEQTYSDFDPKDPDAYIALSLRQNAFLNQSIQFADLIQKNCVDDLKRFNRGVKQAGFMVLYRATMPAVLVELGFLSHAEEGKYLATEKAQNDLANEIFEAFSEYKNTTDGVDGAIGEGKVNAPDKQDDEAIVNNEAVDKDFNEGIKFRVQISTSSIKLKTTASNFKGIQDVSMYQSGTLYKYTVGNYNNLAEAKKRQTLVRSNGFETSFIISFKDGERYDLQKAIKETKQL